MSTIQNIKQSLADVAKTVTGLKDIDKDAISTLLDICIKHHTTFIKAMEKLTPKDKTKFAERLFVLLQASTERSSAVWNKYTKSLNGTVRAAEQKDMFSSLVNTHKTIKSVLQEIKKNLDVLFGEGDTFSPLDIRKSHLAVFGIVIGSTQLTRWSSYAFTYLTALVDGTDKSIPKYREMYLSDNVDNVIKLVNTYFDGRNISFMNDVAIIKSKADDSVLMNNGVVNHGIVDPVTMAAGTKMAIAVIGAIGVTISSLYLLKAFLQWLPERMDLLAHENYLLDKENKEWMESRIAKLRMDLDSIDPNDPKYQTIVRAIDVYDEKIRDLDRKIDAYLTA